MMFLEKRPTCVTVIGWVWVGLGSFTILSAVMALVAQISFSLSGVPVQKSAVTSFFVIMAIVQCGVATLAVIAGIEFLKLRSWARDALEVLTWLSLVFLIGFIFLMLFSSMRFLTSGPPGGGIGFIFLLIMVVMTGAYATPFIIMLKYLRGDRVRNAILGIDDEED